MKTTLKICNSFYNKELYCLLGNPVNHSLSPIIHNKLFEYFNYNGVYFAVSVNDIKVAIENVRNMNIKGCSVTSPYKISVMDYLDIIDDTAIKIGAINTIVNKNNKLIGYNFDYIGAMNALFELSKINKCLVVLLGAGGSARALGYGIKKNGGYLKIVNRTEKKGKDLAYELNSDFCTLLDLFEIDVDIIINTTPVGFFPKVDVMPIPYKLINPSMIIMDIVYNPVETLLLKTAKKIGCKTINGLTMLAYQAALQFECWTHVKPPINLVKKILMDYNLDIMDY